MKDLYQKCRDLYHKYKEVVNYVIFGFLTFVVSTVTYYVSRFCFDYVVSNIISWILAVLFAYITNKLFVFNSKVDSKQNLLKEFVMFVISRIATLILETIILFVMIEWMNITNDFIVKMFAQVVVILTNYILSKVFIFKKKDKVIS